MNFSMLPPRHQLVAIMQRLYEQGLTTTSGGNLSIYDDDGSIWITPAGIDKGSLTPDDIAHVMQNGEYEGRHAPSSELPFHRRIYEARPDIRAIVHAHPTALVAFSLVGQLPSTRLTPQTFELCGEVGYAPYEMTGSDALGKLIADAFASGANVVMLENHGVVTGGSHLLEAFYRFETLEFSAHMQIHATSLGDFTPLSDEALTLFHHDEHFLPEFTPHNHSHAELEGRHAIVAMAHRAYARRLMTSTAGTISMRLADDDFIITPYGIDRKYLDAGDVVRIFKGQREAGTIPSRAVRLHRAIYERHADVNCIMSAQPVGVTSFGLSPSVPFDTRLIPETYIVLRGLPTVDYGVQFTQPEVVAELLSAQTPAILFRHDTLLAMGSTLLQTFDRIEVAEFSAQALLSSRKLGMLHPIPDEAIDALDRKFFPDGV